MEGARVCLPHDRRQLASPAHRDQPSRPDQEGPETQGLHSNGTPLQGLATTQPTKGYIPLPTPKADRPSPIPTPQTQETAPTREAQEGVPPQRPPTTARITRRSSGGLTRKNHGEGPAGDGELAMRMQVQEVEGTASPLKPKPQVRPKVDRDDLKLTMPWFDFVCNRQLQTEDEARKHFAEGSHRKAVEAFLTKHREQLEEEEPESIKVLLSTLPARRQLLAEMLAEEARGGRDAQCDSRPTTPSRQDAPKEDQQEALGKWLARYGREKTIPSRETNPEEPVYTVGVLETQKWHGRYDEMPTPAFCETCWVSIPYTHQAKTHFEGLKHKAKCAEAGDKMVALAIQAREGRHPPRGEHKVSFKAVPPGAKDTDQGPRTPGAPRPQLTRPKSASLQATVEYPCAGANCKGRVIYQAGDPSAVGRCTSCNFKQIVPTKRQGL